VNSPARAGAGRRLTAGLFGLLLLTLACQPPTLAGTPSAAPAQKAGVKGDLAAADTKLFQGDYDGAETDYQALIKAGVPGAESHYALLLSYEGRMREAIPHAQADVDSHSTAGALARLTRAYDWGDDVPSAVKVGAKAVAADPNDPLTHVFYSEALADAGRFDDSERELKAAEKLGGDAYVRAEIDREWANLYRDKGDRDQELNFIQLSLKAQPGFPERSLELARHYYGTQKMESGRSQVTEVSHLFPKSYQVQVLAGDTALLGKDGDTALTIYGTALKLRPAGATASLGEAEVQVALKRNFKAAHDLLVEALKKDPGSAPVYMYLRYLDLLVLKTDADKELNSLAPRAPAGLAAVRQGVFDRVNSYRASVGVKALTQEPAIAEGALAHSYYFLFNFATDQVQGLGIHAEDSTLPGFTGAGSSARAAHFGYHGLGTAEVINGVYTLPAIVDVWADSIYHRYPIIDREASTAGYGEARVGLLTISVLDFGYTGTAPGDPIVYPYPDQKGVPRSFNGNEIPNPVPEGTKFPVGYPVTLQVSNVSALTVSTGKLVGPDGQEVPSYVVTPRVNAGPNEWGLLAKAPLTPGAVYTVEVVGKIDGRDFTKKWSFTSAAD
jgi:tetratricopeptide (TPR) repeat protein